MLTVSEPLATSSSPILYVGNFYGEIGISPIGPTNDNGESEEERTADDIDGNGNAGVTLVLADINGDGIIESGEVVGLINNFGGLHTFNVGYDEASLSQGNRTTSLEIMKQHVLYGEEHGNSLGEGWRFDGFVDDWAFGVGDEARGLWSLCPAQTEKVRSDGLQSFLNDLRFSVYSAGGWRSLIHESYFDFEASGSILGRTWVRQENDHYFMGPQIGLGMVVEGDMFRFEVVALGMMGYGRVEFDQRGLFSTATPDAINDLTTNATSDSAYSDLEQVAWHGETRVTASCQLTRQLRFDVSWRWFATGEVYNPSDSVVFQAPNFGFQQPDGQTGYSSDLFLGLTYNR